MPESWFCESCQSLNRGQSDRCYRCKAPKARVAVATARDRRPNDALMPGVDRLERVREVAGTAQHAYVSPALLGYVSVLGFTVMFAAGLATLAGAVALLGEVVAPDIVRVSDAVARLTGVAAGVFGAGMLLALPCHSIFLWLTTRNVPALAGGTPRYGPGRALLWWLEAYLWRFWAYCIIWVVPGVLLVVVLLFLYFGLEILGLVGFGIALFALWKAGSLLGVRIDFPQHAMDTLRKPARLLEDLVERLALQGTPGRRLVSLWQTSWVTSAMIRFLLPYLVMGLALVIFVLLVARGMARIDFGHPSYSGFEQMLYAFIALLVAITALMDLFAVFFMARVTLALTDAQRARREWLVRGESLQANTLSPQRPQPAPQRPQPALEPPRAWSPQPAAQPAPQRPAPGQPASAFSGPGPQPTRTFLGFVPEAAPAGSEAPGQARPAPHPPDPEPEPGGERPTSRPDIPPGR